ncbi:hypothetical protein SAMN05660831_01712 [Thiohalospira halophila DSM 15071]|uniref:UPF0235 protein SAMN05660831_01712 n=1 Tax=Thiohalospira halophila DSM 15071 TaxID=1123397 RepID=A0A1I1SJB2_9GAMM|nr:DUF167 family protein [Thiohalospira halophila]SFD46579.1 hypothetical protein SAMN05660831_01712 [Thiohalospira halophila DSM 15071]
MAAVERDGDDLVLTLRVQPRAKNDAIVGPHGDAIRVRITAPPVEGKANDHLGRFLAKRFGVHRRDVTLISGESGRDKRVRIAGARPDAELAELLGLSSDRG